MLEAAGDGEGGEMTELESKLIGILDNIDTSLVLIVCVLVALNAAIWITA